MTEPVSAQHTAEAVRAVMLANDTVLSTLGITVDAIGPGSATASMAVRADMLNGFSTCHGGLVSTLADTAFAYACNAYNELTVAASFTVELLAPSHVGDVLTAVAQEMSKSGRTGLYDVDVSNQRGERIAMFRGRSYTLKGRPVIGGLPVQRGA